VTTPAAPGNEGAEDAVSVGDTVAQQYVIESVLGRGASGVVFAAKRNTDSVQVALKVIHPELCHSRQIFGRYKREAEILHRIGGEHIVRFLDFVEHDGLLVIALEQVAGTSLEELLESRLELAQSVSILLQICRGLEVAHKAGVIHRDLKPANVMVEKRADGSLRARILDFGLAKLVHGGHLVTGLTERDMIFGTPEYMAPEQARGDDVDLRCDIYACGVMLYEMVTGSVPLKGRSPLATMTAQLTEAIEAPRARAPGRDIPPALEAVILRALEKDPESRYASAIAFAAALEAALERRVIAITPRHDPGISESDTELTLRRSQIHNAAGLLAEAEKLALSKAEATRPSRPSRPSAAERSAAAEIDVERSPWLWRIVALVAALACIIAGVLLALD